MDNLEALVGKYKQQLEKLVETVEAGFQFRFRGANAHSWILDDDIVACFQAVFSLTYDALQNISAHDVKLPYRINEVVRHPILDDLLDFFEGEKDFNSTKDRFVETFTEKNILEPRQDPNMMILPPVRALALLEVVRRNPERVQKLRENSAYLPHKLFSDRVERKLTQAQISRETELEIAAMLPTLYSDDLVRLVREIDFLVHTGNYFGGSRGKYSLCQGYKFGTEVTEDLLDDIFNPPGVKKEIYNTLAECMLLIKQTACDKKREKGGRGLRHFALYTSHYVRIIEALKRYGFNQMLYAFKESGGRVAIQTFITRSVGIYGRIVGGELQIYDSYHRSTSFLKLDSAFYDTTSILPMCLSVLSKFYKSAEELAPTTKPENK